MRVIGLMSGTSMDGIDGAILETNGEYYINLLHTASLSYDKDFALALKMQTPHDIDPNIVQKSTELHAKVIQALIEKNNHSHDKKIELIGYHGQTIHHDPKAKITLQIGNPAYLANTFHTPVVYDFRTQDVLHGGQGAPLAPLYHHALLHQKSWNNVVVVNIGGIANVSLIKNKKIIAGFDPGPGNRLLDQFVRTWTENKYLFDYNGEFANQGKTDNEFLKILFEKTTLNHYYQKPPPKSLDTQDIIFIPEILERFPRTQIQHLYDGCKTLAEFTAYTIVHSISTANDFHYWIVTGGGAKNLAIFSALKNLLAQDIEVKAAEQIGWNAATLEAELIAWLAVRSIKNMPLTLPETTGVERPMIGGKCAFPDYSSHTSDFK